MSNSSASSATIVAIAVLENGRFCEGQGRALIFDAQIYLGENCPALLAALKYFNADNQAFDPVGFYIVIARLIPIAKDGVSPLYTPYIEICSTVKYVDDLTNTFSIDAHQFYYQKKGCPVIVKSLGSISAITEIRSFYKWNTGQTWVEIRLLSDPLAY
ncbi:hypothetical protein BDR06DRAFT_975488 [Suillus hirtellus]|nr:hypothetical protein BDR06DRAFT_975488 [Suillus hirtellus]